MWLCLCMYAIDIHIYEYMYIYIYTYIYVCMLCCALSDSVDSAQHRHIYTYIYILCVYVCVCVCVCGNPLQHSCLENSMNRGVWWATVHVVIKSWAQLITYLFYIPTSNVWNFHSSTSFPVLYMINLNTGHL